MLSLRLSVRSAISVFLSHCLNNGFRYITMKVAEVSMQSDQILLRDGPADCLLKACLIKFDVID